MEQKQIKYINEICRFLSCENTDGELKYKKCDNHRLQKADVIVALGSDLIQVVEAACKLYNDGLGEYLLFCGGIGHSTRNLKEKIGKKLSIHIENLPDTEAELYCIIAKAYDIPEERILIESSSTNTAENCIFGTELLKRNHINVKSIILLQDPLLQRRSYVTAIDHFPKETKILCYPPFVPQLDAHEEYTLGNDQLWTKKRFLELVFGEMNRLIDDENGYGPKGKGFIRHVDIPDYVMEAYEMLKSQMKEYTTRCF